MKKKEIEKRRRELDKYYQNGSNVLEFEDGPLWWLIACLVIQEECRRTKHNFQWLQIAENGAMICDYCGKQEI